MCAAVNIISAHASIVAVFVLYRGPFKPNRRRQLHSFVTRHPVTVIRVIIIIIYLWFLFLPPSPLRDGILLSGPGNFFSRQNTFHGVLPKIQAFDTGTQERGLRISAESAVKIIVFFKGCLNSCMIL